jgi:hypothetical protein
MFGSGNRMGSERGGVPAVRSDAGAPGKQTLTSGLDAARSGGGRPGLSAAGSSIEPQQAEPTQTAEQAANQAETDAYYAEVSRVIQQILADYQNIRINARTTPPPAVEGPAAEGTAAPAAEGTAAPAAEGTAAPAADGTAAPAADGTAVPAASPKVRVTVHTPYWNNKYPNYDSERGNDPINNPVPPVDYSSVARQAAFDAYDEAARANATVLDDPPPGGTESTAVAVAKGSPEQITSLVQNAVDLHVLAAPVPAAGVVADDAWWIDAWTAAIQQWMVQVGIGVDCNGLVFQAMLRVRAAAPEGRTSRVNGASGVTDYYDASRATRVGTEAFGGDDIDPDPNVTVALGEDIPDLLELQPGDVMYLSHSHVRIVMSVERRNRAARVIEFTTAESTVDGRTGEGQTYEGPRVHYWRWDGDLRERYEGSDPEDPLAWTDAEEAPSYRRHLVPPA